jgi:hypothetical protein
MLIVVMLSVVAPSVDLFKWVKISMIFGAKTFESHWLVGMEFLQKCISEAQRHSAQRHSAE